MLRRERSEIQPESGAAHSSNGDGAIMQNKSDVSDFTTNTFLYNSLQCLCLLECVSVMMTRILHN